MTECQLSDAPARRSCLSPFSLLCREPEKREQLRSQLTRDLQSDLGVYSYRTRLFCYSLFLFACELLALGGALSRSAQPQENSALTAQLSILLVLLCTTVPLFVTAYYCQHYWVRVATQATSFVLSACGFILMDGHFLGRETDSSKWETTINGLVPVAFLTSLLPPVLMYSWFVYFLVVAFALFVTLALRVAGSEWEVGTLEAGMAVLWLFAFCPLLYKMELSIKTNYLSSASTISEERFAPPKRGRTVTFATCDEVIGTELEDILEKLDKLQTVLQDAVVPDKQWAEETLSEVMSKLAMGRSIYQPFLHSKAGDIDPENLKFVEQNYMQTRVDPTIVKMGSVADSRSATQVELSTSYGVTELLPLLQKLGKDWNFDIFFVSHCTDNHALQTCGEFTMKKFNFPELLETGETVFRSFFDALAAVTAM